MKEKTIHLNSIDAVKEFVRITMNFDFDIDICSEDRHYVIDAKSIMGIFSLDLSKPVIIVANTTDSGVEPLFRALAKFD